MMPEDRQTIQQTAEFVHALGLLKASHEMYREILGALRANVDHDGSPNLPELFRQLNAALTGFAPRDLEIRRLLSRFQT